MSLVKLTVALLFRDDKVLLGLKKRGLGAGVINGYGGHVEDGETPDTSMVREVYEESGYKIKVLDFIERGVINFRFEDKPDKTLEIHFYEVLKHEGEPIETDEMTPLWFNRDNMPYDRMWEADRHWAPLLLARKRFVGDVLYNNSIERKIITHSIRPI